MVDRLDPNTSTFNRLGAVSCTSDLIVAVGDSFNRYANQTLVETFNGATWSIAASPNTSMSSSNVLTGVSCTSATSCVAVGTANGGTAFQTLVEAFDGNTWTLRAEPEHVYLTTQCLKRRFVHECDLVRGRRLRLQWDR